MTTYPAIPPSSRNFGPGKYPHSIFRALSGAENSVRHSSAMVESSVELRYSALDEAEMIEILDHYNSVKGGFLSFAVPNIVWRGNENPNDFTIMGNAWRYSQPPEVEEVFCGGGTGNSGAGYNVTVILESIPGEGVGILGHQFKVRTVFTPGVAATANGPHFVIKSSLLLGWGFAPGFTITATNTFTPGIASGGIGVIVEGRVFGARAKFRSGFGLDGTARLFTARTSLRIGGFYPSTYSQSSIFAGTTPASTAIMTDGQFNNTGAATDLDNPAWIKLDLGNVYEDFQIIIGTATNSIPGQWNKSYTENKNIQYSTDNTNWTTAFSTGTFPADGIYIFNANFAASYIRIATTGNDYLGVSEFYVRSTRPELPITSQITYSQSSVYAGTTPASTAIMTDGQFNNTGAATDLENPAWIKMDLGEIYDVYEIIVGTATNSIPGGWGSSYTGNKNIQYSTDNTSWTTAFNTGQFGGEGIYTFRANFVARYIRIATTGSDWVAISEFYARVLSSNANATGGASVQSPVFTVETTFTAGTASSG